MAESLKSNFADCEANGQSVEIGDRCVKMIASLFNAPASNDYSAAIGAACVGSSEAIILSTLAMKNRWQNKRKAMGKAWSNPNIVLSSAAQIDWKKATSYFDIAEKYIYCTNDRFVIDPQEALRLVDENTIGICATLGTVYTGEYEDVKTINDLLIKQHIDCPIHVDATNGGFVVPFVVPDLEWDFRLSKVVSINASGDSYGLVGLPPTTLIACYTPNKVIRSIQPWDGLFGDPPSISQRSSCSTSIQTVQVTPTSASTFPIAHPRSSDSITRWCALGRVAIDLLWPISLGLPTIFLLPFRSSALVL